MRLLDIDGRAGAPPVGTDVDDAALATLYAWPAGPWVRANFVTTLDGSVVGADGLSGSINTPADHRIFATLRELCDAVVVGAGTVRAEGYKRLHSTSTRADPAWLVIVSASGRVSHDLIGPASAEGGRGILVTTVASGRAPSEHVWICGEDTVDLPQAMSRLTAAGAGKVLTEGGPRLFADLLAADLVDELALTLVPTLVGGAGGRITLGPALERPLAPRHLLEQDGTLLGLWRQRS